MRVKTRVFEIAAKRGMGILDLARAMGLHNSMVYRVRAGTRGINDAFIEGTRRAFPEISLDDLFYVEPRDCPEALQERPGPACGPAADPNVTTGK